MDVDYDTLQALRKTHPAWKLLVADHSPLIAAFLHNTFIVPNQRRLSRADLASALEDLLFTLRETQGEDAFPRSAQAYLDDWAGEDKGWLRKFYPQGSDEVHYDLMPAAQKALSWLENLIQRPFVGTESRLMTIFDLLRQMVEGTEKDVQVRIQELEKRKAAIENELAQVRSGRVEMLDDTAVRDRFLQVSQTARELLGDFREVEYNFRLLDRKIREQITLWEGSKAHLLEDFFGERDMIAESDQGKSFTAFWDLLMSPARQEELTGMLEKVFDLAAVKQLSPDRRLKRVHYDWLSAGEHTQRTVAKLSGQLRRYLDDQAFLENKRIMQVIQQIEARAVRLRDQMPQGSIMTMDETSPDILLPMERPLYKIPVKPKITDTVSLGDGSNIPADMLHDIVFVDRLKLKQRIRNALQTRDQVFLAQILSDHPLEKGLAELVTYLTLAAEDDNAWFDDSLTHQAVWTDAAGIGRQATFNAVIFSR
ncbi:MAG: DUF3375 domain-containing protein [Desulfotignum sp.]|nr:DUF3375 domain-containing protein [Desulfotignum sp.]